jgi:hypothetical protein
MAPENPTDRLKGELSRAVEKLKVDLDRVELLTAALSAFHRPVPDYEPTFRHTQRMDLTAHELRSETERRNFRRERQPEMHAGE